MSKFTILEYPKYGKMHYSALGGVVFKSGVQIEPIRFYTFSGINFQNLFTNNAQYM